MDIRLNDEQTMIRDTVRDIARERIAPRAAEIDRSGEFPWDIVDLYRKQDLFALPFPPEYGGLSGSALRSTSPSRRWQRFARRAR